MYSKVAVTQYFDNPRQEQQETPSSSAAPAFEAQIASPPPQEQAPKRKAPA
jgi:hypothetical protein